MNLARITDSGDTLRVEARFKNARLYDAIAERSYPLGDTVRAKAMHAMGPVAAFCEIHGISRNGLNQIYRLLNLRLSPFMKRGGGFGHRIVVRPICERLSVLLEKDVYWLFPADLYRIEWPRLAVSVPHTRFVPLLRAPGTAFTLPASQEDDAISHELSAAIVDAMESLTPREQHVLRSRFGFESDDRTLEDIGREIGVSKDRVRQIEAKALRKMRHPTRTRRLGSFIAPRGRWSDRKPAQLKPEITSSPSETLPQTPEVVISLPNIERKDTKTTTGPRRKWQQVVMVLPEHLAELDKFIHPPDDAFDVMISRLLIPTKPPQASTYDDRITVIIVGMARRKS